MAKTGVNKKLKKVDFTIFLSGYISYLCCINLIVISAYVKTIAWCDNGNISETRCLEPKVGFLLSASDAAFRRYHYGDYVRRKECNIMFRPLILRVLAVFVFEKIRNNIN